MFEKDIQYYKFCSYGFLKNLKFFEPFFILYLVEAGISFFHIGILFTIRAVAVNIMEIPSGVIADLIGRRKAMILSFVSYIVSFLLFFFVPVFAVITAAMIFFAFGEAFRTGTHKAMIIDYLDNKGWGKYRTHYYGHTRSWSQRGSAVSALIAAALVFWSGSYRPVFLFTLIPYVLELGLMLSYPSWLDGKNSDKRNKKSAIGIFRELGEVLANSRTRRAFLSSSIPSGFFEAAKDYIQPIIAVFGISLPVLTGIADEQRTALISGIIYSIIFILTSTASGIAAPLSEKIGSEEKHLNLTFPAVMAVLLIAGVLRTAELNLLSIIIFMMFYFIQNLRRPITVGYLSAQIDGGIMATALSVDSQLKTLWVALLSPLIGLLIDNLGLGTALTITGAIGLLLFPFIRLRKSSQASE